MFKKVIFIETNRKKLSIFGVLEWINYCAKNFFFFSSRELELNAWYEIIYYQGNSGVFRLKQARLIGLGQQLPNTIQNIQNIQQQNIFMLVKCSENCIIPNCFECKIKQTISTQEYRELLQDRAEYEEARNTFDIQKEKLTTGLLFLNGKEVKWFATKNEAEKWKGTIKKDIQWSFANLEAGRK